MISRIRVLFFFVLPLFYTSCSNVQNPQSVEVTLVKALDMRCRYSFNYNVDNMKITCINTAGDTCISNLTNINKEFYDHLFVDLKMLGDNSFELEKVNEGQFLKINISWENESQQVIIVKNFSPNSRDSSLYKIHSSLDILYNNLDSIRCW